MKRMRAADTSALPDVLLAIGAALLTFGGVDPIEVARRAESAASGIRRMRSRFEEMAEQHVKSVVGCKKPDPCDCILCSERERERDERRPS